ncbi:DNA-methyltransferase [Trueperella pyogenes]|uniref:DNA-methyltransferase n=1 Tax=Trueperella pyogenes TaxID=1661 RepID=UPI003872DD13
MTSSSAVFKQRPGYVRDAILATLVAAREPEMSLAQITDEVARRLGGCVSSSSIRSSLNLNVGKGISRTGRGQYALTSRLEKNYEPDFSWRDTALYLDDCLSWMNDQPENSIHAVVTDPPYGVVEYSTKEQDKLKSGRGGVWRIPPTLDGSRRSPLPRFTTLSAAELEGLVGFFTEWARAVKRVLVPGGNVIVACNPLLSHRVSIALERGGLERRGELIRIVQTLRGGDRPKGAHKEFADVSVMPRSQWEPWLIYRKELDGTAANNLTKWGTGGFRRISDEQPFGDVIKAPPARGKERQIAPHPSLKPQLLMRQIVRASLPLGVGIVLDPFAGSGSTLAAAQAIGYRSIGIERDPDYFKLAQKAIPALAEFENTGG